MNIKVRNVNEAYWTGKLIMSRTPLQKVEVRGNTVGEYPSVFTTTYTRPTERVLFCPVRNANPFFHFIESLWILAGRKDVETLRMFNSQISQYSDDGVTFHGAYGYRLKRRFKNDQIYQVINLLRKDPNTRRAVLQIWDADLDLDTDSNDIPCNDMIFLKLRNGKLDITVLNRSNDMIWGAYGANAVQFSVIQEYIASAIGAEVGTYTQVSNNFHVYLTGKPGELWNKISSISTVPYDPYVDGYAEPFPMINDFDTWNMELHRFIDFENHPEELTFEEPFFEFVAAPIYVTWLAYKIDGVDTAIVAAETIRASDWRLACLEWLHRIKIKREVR